MDPSWDCEIRDGEPITDFTNAYNPEYLEELKRIEKNRICPFSPKTLAAQGRPILYEVAGWFVVECRPPYRDKRNEVLPYHYLIVSKRHGLWIPSPEDMWSIGYCMQWINRLDLRAVGWGLAVCLGDRSEFAGQSIRHNHLHFFSPNVQPDPRTPSGPRSVPVSFGFF